MPRLRSRLDPEEQADFLAGPTNYKIGPLVRQGLWEAAIAFAEAARDDATSQYDHLAINRFCGETS